MSDVAYIKYEPFGTVLIINPWNFPYVLNFNTLAGAIAAGNTSIIKPSEIAPYSAMAFKKLINKYLDGNFFKVINGGVSITTKVLEYKWNFICYTGSPNIAKIIGAAANKHLTPVCFELGGKNPVFIDHSTIDLKIVARRIAWGKCLNNGQACIAPDYIIIHPDVKELFVKYYKEAIDLFYPQGFKNCNNVPRIVDKRNLERVINLLPKNKEDGVIAYGGGYDMETRIFEPTLITDIKNIKESKLLKDEIFGPILPIIDVDSFDQALKLIKNNEELHNPLALYIFSQNEQYIENVINNVRSGGVCVNDTIMHHQLSGLPFGGIGNSGIGKYHGKFSFDLFSHSRSILKMDYQMEFANVLRYGEMDHGDIAYPITFPDFFLSPLNSNNSNVLVKFFNNVKKFSRWSFCFMILIFRYYSGGFKKC